MDEDDIWTLEERLWTGGAEVYARHMHPACVMTLPSVGILRGSAIADSVCDAPRWRDIEMTDRTLDRPDEGVAVLAYRASGSAAHGTRYVATCASVYLRVFGEWLLAYHGQVPDSGR
jgi:hypothetical protein